MVRGRGFTVSAVIAAVFFVSSPRTVAFVAASVGGVVYRSDYFADFPYRRRIFDCVRSRALPTVSAVGEAVVVFWILPWVRVRDHRASVRVDCLVFLRVTRGSQ